MQLILNTDSDIGFERNMSVINRNETLLLEEKFTNNTISNTGENDTETVKEEEDKDNSEDCQDDGDIVDERRTENIVVETEKHIQKESSGDEESNLQDLDDNVKENTISEDIEVKDELDENDTNSKDLADESNKIIQNDKTESNAQENFEINENVVNCDETCEKIPPENEDIKDDQDTTDIYSYIDNDVNINYNSVKITNVDEQETQGVVDENTEKITKRKAENEFTMRVKKVSEINENLFDLSNFESENKKVLLEKSNMDNMTGDKHNSLDSYTQFDTLEENLNKELELNKGYSSIDNEEVISIGDEKDEESVSVIDSNNCNLAKESESELNLVDNLAISNKQSKTDDEKNDQVTGNREIVENQENLIQEKDDMTNEQTANKVKPPGKSKKDQKPLLHISKLSNTLDILSDEEEDISMQESQSKTSEKQCINIEDDDDIMLLDEEAKETNKTGCTATSESINEIHDITEQTNEHTNKDITENDKDSNDSKVENVIVTETDINSLNQDEGQKETQNENNNSRPLLPANFLTSCKKNLADMTREELEEFCVLKIVESVVDRSNLTEMNLQLKTLAQSIEEFKKKTATLMKQNRDLQVVLKSVQEEQKKNPGHSISPLKITRSVGMQVLMIETPSRKKPSSHKFPNSLPINSVKSAKAANSKLNKSQNGNNQNIPVPRLVPAVNNTNTNNKTPILTPIAPKIQSPNGLRNSPPTSKPEKRPYSKMQQGNSVTVDLTDDEPPSKVVQRNIAPPVRLVPQSLLNSQRPQFVNAINTPRKVYIPISGAQNQVGQTIVLKQFASHVPRLRGPAVIQKPVAPVRLPRMSARHPAPLPDCMKQYQPPNWKALPPAPELKLSKVDNGIVISWKIDGYQEENHEEIASYQLYAYQETSSPPNTALWKKIGDVKALPLPMACTLTQFMSGYKYYFAVRAVDIRSRLGPFSLPGSILLLNKLLD